MYNDFVRPYHDYYISDSGSHKPSRDIIQLKNLYNADITVSHIIIMIVIINIIIIMIIQ